MPKVIVHFSVSLDGFGAAPQQSLENPMGVGGMALADWAFPTRTFHRLQGSDGGTSGIDDDFMAQRFLNVGAFIFGRNMFGPVRGPWPDNTWNGWWGESPPFRSPVFVLSHYPRETITMQGGTTFHFVTDGIQRALERAKAAARARDVCIGGGVATIRQYLCAGLIDQMNLAIAPLLLGSGERFLGDIDLVSLGYRCTEHVAGEHATHVRLVKTVP
jgi:dihydrofolate reductase